MNTVDAPSWGRFPRVAQQALGLHDRDAPLPRATGRLLPRGNGRSYGDSCLAPDGTLLLTRGLDRFIRFDPTTGVLACEAGTTLHEILALAVPQGWFLPVVPGTAEVTVGGAIANDVHGKNHHVAGTFGHHVRRFALIRSDGSVRECVPGAADGWFEATVGGLGLTGLIPWAELQLRRISGPQVRAESERFDDLAGFFRLSRAAAGEWEYTVAWIDCLARGRRLGRGVFHRGRHADGSDGARAAAPSRRWTLPVAPPFSLVNPLSLRLFNTAYVLRAPRRPRTATVHYAPFFFPLDTIRRWNLAYGRRGFLQHQSVLPPERAPDALAAMLDAIARAGMGSFLAVLKEFGDRAPAGLLSFPRPGTTLALDFPNTGPRLFALLDRLDAIVADAGGALYPAKDARMAPAMFRASFPRLDAFLPYLDPSFSSGFWRRVMEPS
jgi:FAD/FMN-containing dehydrogenase